MLTKRETLAALERAILMLRVTSAYMRENDVAAEYTIHYDGVECDGYCVADDCDSAAEELKLLVDGSSPL